MASRRKLSGLAEAWGDLRRAPVTSRTGNPAARRLRLPLAVAWSLGLGAWTRSFGPRLDLQELLLWLALAMFVASVGNPLGWVKSMAVDWLPLYVLLVGYDIVWGLVDNLWSGAHLQPQLSFDRALFGPDGPVAPLQRWLWSGQPRPFDYAIWVVYLSHFVVTLAVCAALWMRSRQDFLAYRRRVVTSWCTGLVVFALYPTVPPWMAAKDGLLPHVTRVIGAVNRSLAPDQTRQVLSDGGGKIDISNPVAAVPSMHSALPMLLLLFCWNRAPRLRPLLVAYPLTMAFALIYAGEHYLFDVLAGWLVAVLVHIGWRRLEARRRPGTLPAPHVGTAWHPEAKTGEADEVTEAALAATALHS